MEYDPAQEARNNRYSRQAYDHDEDDGFHHGPRVQQCTTS